MKTSSAFALALALSASAVPLESRWKDPKIDDKTILNFALTLEHLEDAFYSGAMNKFDEKAFTDAGFPSDAYLRFSQIAEHEATHVAFLTKALGPDATKPCTYDFPYNDPKSFAMLSQIFEGVGTSAYAGAVHFLKEPDHVTGSAVILSTEARQNAWVASHVNNNPPWSGSFDIPLTLDEAFSLAAPFIKSCPSSNPKLSVKAFPALNITLASGGANVTPGSEVQLQFDAASKKSGELSVAFFTGLYQYIVPIKDNKVTVPPKLTGTVYAVVTSTKDGKDTDATVVAGPVVLLFPDDTVVNSTKGGKY